MTDPSSNTVVPLDNLSAAIATIAVSAATQSEIAAFRYGSQYQAVFNADDHRARLLLQLAIGYPICITKSREEAAITNAAISTGHRYREKILASITADEHTNLAIKSAAGRLSASQLCVFAANLVDRVEPIEAFCTKKKDRDLLRPFLTPYLPILEEYTQ